MSSLNMRASMSFKWAVLIASGAVAAGLGVAMSAGFAPDQETTGPEMTDFRAQLENHSPPNEAQVKTLLEGAKAQPRSGRYWITDARLSTFGTNGTLDMLAEAPQCIYDSATKTVSSTGPLQIQSADRRFLIEGEGFLLQQTNSNLIISSRVHTVVRGVTAGAPRP